MNKSSVGLTFVKKHLPKHLHPYAHLLTYVVNDRLSWLEGGAKGNTEYALLLSMAVLDKSWKKWQENPVAYTEAQFCSYVKKTVDWMVLKEFATHIQERQDQLLEYKEKLIAEREELEEIAGTLAKPPIPLSEYSPGIIPNLSSLLRIQHSETLEELEDEGHTSGDFDQVFLTDEDGNTSSTGRFRTSISDETKLFLLLPDREGYMIRFGSGGRIAAISRDWGISRVRGQQIHKAGMERLYKVIKRLQSGETFDDLLKESRAAQQVAAKKEMAGKDIEYEKEFREFCDMNGLSSRTIYARNLFVAHEAWINEEGPAEAEFESFCKTEGYLVDSEEAFDEYRSHLYTIHCYLPQEIRK